MNRACSVTSPPLRSLCIPGGLSFLSGIAGPRYELRDRVSKRGAEYVPTAACFGRRATGAERYHLRGARFTFGAHELSP
jgi:hypothetical protein